MIEWKKYDRVEEVRQVGRGRKRRERVVEGTGWEGRGREGQGRGGEVRGEEGMMGKEGKEGKETETGEELDDSACNTHAEYSH